MTQFAPDHGPVAQCIADATGIILGGDAAYFSLLERERSEVVGCHALNLTYLPDRAYNAPLLERIRGEGTPFAVTKRYMRGGGGLIWVTNHVSAITDGLGPRRLVSTSRVISSPITHGVIERNLAEARRQVASLSEAKRALGADLAVGPSLEVLLLLYLAEMKGALLSCDELAAEMKMQPTMVVRWLSALQMRRLVDTEDDEPLAPGAAVRITVECQAQLDTMLMRMGETQGA